MSSVLVPPGLETYGRTVDEDLVFLILSELAKNTSRSWVKLMHVYASSPTVSHQNSIASTGLSSFIMPRDLLKAARMEPCLEVREKNREWEIRQKQQYQKNMNKAIATVLRYDVADWLKLSSLQTLVESRFGLQTSFGVVFIAILEDPVRFELEWWDEEWWARATYRYCPY